MQPIEVNDVPPKKDGANSMWGKASEIPRIKELRRKVLAGLDGREPSGGSVSLELTVFAPASAGDLDNFITGICDSLMAAHPSVRWSETAWADVPREAWPDRALVYLDDSQVQQITARRERAEGAARYVLVVGLAP